MIIMRAASIVVIIAALSTCTGLSLDAIPEIPIAPGVNMPIVGVGSCCGSYNISDWLKEGGRHIDTSCDYGSEPDIGNVVKASGISRNELFITSKINPENYSSDVGQAYIQEVLEPLQMEYVDLLLMHHAGRVKGDPRPLPSCFNSSDAGGRGAFYTCRVETFKSLLALKEAGKVRAIGVSNFEVRDLEQLYEVTGEFPSNNQIEYHPYWHNDTIAKYCKAHNISVTAYAPMGAYPRSAMLDDTIVKDIAAAHKTTVGPVVLSWELAWGADIVIPRSKTPAHMEENLSMFDVQLSDEEMRKLSALPQKKIYNTQCQPWC